MFQFDALLSAVAGKTVYKEIWEEYTQEISSCCECGMYSAIYNKIATKDDWTNKSSRAPEVKSCLIGMTNFQFRP